VLAEEAQQISHQAREERVGAEEEQGEDDRHDHHHDGGGDRFLAARPVDLAGLHADLSDEFAGGDFGHSWVRSLAFRIEKRPAGLCGQRGCGSLSGGWASLQGRSPLKRKERRSRGG
jgi:hypothetical protein